MRAVQYNLSQIVVKGTPQIDYFGIGERTRYSDRSWGARIQGAVGGTSGDDTSILTMAQRK
jgi:hypothetical protein